MDTKPADRLRIARERLGLTRGQMAERLDLAFSTYAMIERGERTLTPKHIKNIVEKTGVSREWLETGEGEVMAPDRNAALYDLIMSLEEADRDMLIDLARRLVSSNK